MKRTNYAILRMGRFGRKVAQPLASAGADVMIADIDEKKVNSNAEHYTHAVVIDLTNVAALKKIGLEHIDIAIVDLAHNTEAAVMSIMFAKEVGVKKVIATAATGHGAEILRRIGADEVIIPEDDAARWTARKLISEEFMEYFDLGGDLCVLKMHPPVAWVDKKISDLNLREENINIIAFENDGIMKSDFQSDYVIRREEIIVLATTKSKVFNFV